MKPALDENAWQMRAYHPLGLHLGIRVVSEGVEGIAIQNKPHDARYFFYGENRHALAALALHGQPFGFTREDVKMLRIAADAYEEDSFYFRELIEDDEELPDEDPWPARYRAFADRIESLLPPEKK